MTTLKGNITVLRNSSGSINMKIRDEASGVTFVMIAMNDDGVV